MTHDEITLEAAASLLAQVITYSPGSRVETFRERATGATYQAFNRSSTDGRWRKREEGSSTWTPWQEFADDAAADGGVQ